MKIEQLYQLKKEQLTKRQEKSLRLVALDAERGDWLIKFAMGDESARKQIAALQKERESLVLEIESIDTMLAGIPAQEMLAQADEVETTINQIEAGKADLLKAVIQVDTDIEKMVVSLKSVFDVLEKINAINPDFLRNPQYNKLEFENSIGLELRKHGLWKYVKMGDFRNPVSMSEMFNSGKSYQLRGINGLLVRMKTAIEKIRAGEKLPFCPKCYGNMVKPTPESDYLNCRDCGHRAEG